MTVYEIHIVRRTTQVTEFAWSLPEARHYVRKNRREFGPEDGYRITAIPDYHKPEQRVIVSTGVCK